MAYPVTDEQRERVAQASRSVIARRQEICVETKVGLTTLYNAVDEGAHTDLRAMHDELDEAVAVAYGWPASIAHDGDEIVHRLLTLNEEIAAGSTYDPPARRRGRHRSGCGRRLISPADTDPWHQCRAGISDQSFPGLQGPLDGRTQPDLAAALDQLAAVYWRAGFPVRR